MLLQTIASTLMKLSLRLPAAFSAETGWLKKIAFFLPVRSASLTQRYVRWTGKGRTQEFFFSKNIVEGDTRDATREESTEVAKNFYDLQTENAV